MEERRAVIVCEDLRPCCHFEDGRRGHESRIGLKNLKGPSADSQQGKEHLSPTTAMNWNLLTTPWVRTWSSWRTSNKEHSLHFSLVRPCRAFDFQNYKVINVCSLSLHIARACYGSNRWIHHVWGFPRTHLLYHKQYQSIPSENHRSKPMSFILGNQGICNSQRSWEHEGQGIYLYWCLAEAEAVAPKSLCGATIKYKNLSEAPTTTSTSIILPGVNLPSANASSCNSPGRVITSLPVCILNAHKCFLQTNPKPQRWKGPGTGAPGLFPTRQRWPFIYLIGSRQAVWPARTQKVPKSWVLLFRNMVGWKYGSNT